jgi:hypothetical protein
MSEENIHKHLPSIDKHKGKPMRFIDMLNFNPMMGEARFTVDGIYKNFTQLAISENPKDANMIQSYLDSRGYREISFLGRGLYGLAFDTDGKFILNIRTINYYQYERFANENSMETQTLWSETTIPLGAEAILRPKRYKVLQRGEDSKYLVCEMNKLKTLEEAINDGTLTETQAECLRQSLLIKLAKEGYFLWDGRMANIGIGSDFTPYVLDIGAAERFERLTNVQFIKGISNQNLGGDCLLSEHIRMDPKARKFDGMVDFPAIDKMTSADGGIGIKHDKVFGAKRFKAYMLEQEIEMPPEKIIPQWDGSWVDAEGVAKQDSQTYFEQIPERALFSNNILQEIKSKTPSGRSIISDAIEEGLYRHQWQTAIGKAMIDNEPDKGFCEKIKTAVEDVKDQSPRK